MGRERSQQPPSARKETEDVQEVLRAACGRADATIAWGRALANVPGFSVEIRRPGQKGSLGQAPHSATASGRIPLAFAWILSLAPAGCDPTSLEGPVDAYFAPDALDFGPRALGEVHTLHTSLVNPSGRGLRVRSVRTDPPRASFAARLDNGDTLSGSRLPPGSSTAVRILFGPDALADHDTTMIVEAVDSELALRLAGFGRPPRASAPVLSTEHVHFADPVELGREVGAPLVLTHRGADGAPLDGTRAGPFSVALRGGRPLHEAPSLAHGDRIDLEVRFLPSQVGAFDAWLELSAGAEPTRLRVSGTSTPAGALACDPRTLDFGTVPRGSTVDRTVTCVVEGGAYTLQSATMVSPFRGFSVVAVSREPEDPVRTLRLDLRFLADGIAERLSSALEIRAFHPAVSTIPLHAQVGPPLPSETDLALTLTWSAEDADLDLHLVALPGEPYEGGRDCHWAAKTLNWGDPDSRLDDPFLDRDAIRGPGHEQINLIDARRQTYDVWVQYFGHDGLDTPSVEARMTYSLRGALPGAAVATMDGCGDMWRVGTFAFSGATAEFTPSSELDSRWRDRTHRCP